MERIGRFKVFLICILVQGSTAIDPCTSYSTVHRSDSRGTNCFVEQKSTAVCDRLLKPGWYKAEANGISLEMASSCPPMYSCGTESQLWMDGKSSSVSDGVVNRKVCIRDTAPNDCCNVSMQIQMKNCGSFYVYNLNYTDGCNRAYCFGNNKCPKRSLTTVPQTSTKQPIGLTNTLPANDPCNSYVNIYRAGLRGTMCKIYDVETAVCDRLLKPGWYKAEENGIPMDMPTYCVDSYSCGTAAPIWLNGSLSLRPYETAHRKACVKGFGSSTCCRKSIDIRIKNCISYNVYYLPYTDFCDTAYCFGQHECKIEQTTKKENVQTSDGGISNQTVAIIGTLVIIILMLLIFLGIVTYRYLTRGTHRSSKVKSIKGPVVSVHSIEYTKT
ncbi:uncharacterized protein [Mytilus edulis]|uniref:uncharacterized protein n=1 Tax=Mytilus edulis TaxID=6550 RepID=UPI0039F065B3